jgi:hypothetical protein
MLCQDRPYALSGMVQDGASPCLQPGVIRLAGQQPGDIVLLAEALHGVQLGQVVARGPAAYLFDQVQRQRTVVHTRCHGATRRAAPHSSSSTIKSVSLSSIVPSKVPPQVIK